MDISFKPVDAQSIVQIKPYLRLQTFRTCDYTAGALFMWRSMFQTEYALAGGMLLFRYADPDGLRCFSMPVGGGSLAEALAAIRETAGPRVTFGQVPEGAMEPLTAFFGTPLHDETIRDEADYLYEREALAEMAGKRYSSQRNRIHRLLREHPQFVYRPADEDSLPRLLAFLQNERDALEKDSGYGEEEYARAIEIVPFAPLFGLTGGYVEDASGRIVGMTLGETAGDTVYVHIEKALREFSGTYQLLVREYARQTAAPGVLYMNREEDDGDPGLRQSKTDYHPLRLLMKHTVTFDTNA